MNRPVTSSLTLADKPSVAGFWESARELFDAAESAAGAGQMPSDLTILVSAEGSIHMLAESDWPLDSLLAHHGARMAYRVSHRFGEVRLEGRCGAQQCRFESDPPGFRRGGKPASEQGLRRAP